MEHVQSNLKTIRETAGISQNKLADAIGVDRKTIIAIESGNGSDSMISTVRRIMAYLKNSFEELYPEDVQRSKEAKKHLTYKSPLL